MEQTKPPKGTDAAAIVKQLQQNLQSSQISRPSAPAPEASRAAITLKMCTAPSFVPKTFHAKTFSPKTQAICKSLLCFLVDSKGNTIKIRAILDSASELNLLKRDVSDVLGLQGNSVVLHMITTGGDQKIIKGQKEVEFRLRSLNGQFQSELMHACTTPEISDNVLPCSVNPRKFSHLKNLVFTEPLPQTAYVGKKYPFSQIFSALTYLLIIFQ